MSTLIHRHHRHLRHRRPPLTRRHRHPELLPHTRGIPTEMPPPTYVSLLFFSFSFVHYFYFFVQKRSSESADRSDACASESLLRGLNDQCSFGPLAVRENLSFSTHEAIKCSSSFINSSRNFNDWENINIVASHSAIRCPNPSGAVFTMISSNEGFGESLKLMYRLVCRLTRGWRLA